MTGLSIALNGCANVYISKESLSKIRSIEIDTTVSIPDEPVVDGPVNITSNLIQGLLTGSSPLPENVGAPFGVYMDVNEIKMDQIVLRTFRRYLSEKSYFELREGGDATLELVVFKYGFGTPMFDITKNQRNPELVIGATLRSKDSTVLWKKHEYVLRGSELTHAYSIQALLANPDLVEKSLEEASCVIAHLLLSELDPVRPSPGELPNVQRRIPACDPVFSNDSRIECEPGVGCIYYKGKTGKTAPSQNPTDRRIKCTPYVGCTYQ
ncbi:MAG: hypothetical protein BMS9Abin01_1780 [Gammaproteobacteria bacterium]|nr:MAG: hypothetical protein BMS9Abin01_1780 [Gammaproteobacteria bacterium]